MLCDLDPAVVTVRDAEHAGRIIVAQEGMARADRESHDAARAAHEVGDSSLSMGTALGVTKQAAQKRFSHLTPTRATKLPSARRGRAR